MKIDKITFGHEASAHWGLPSYWKELLVENFTELEEIVD